MSAVLVVTPVWNTRGDWLRECFASVRDQDVSCRHVVADDGSDRPDTLAALAEFEQAGGVVMRWPHGGVLAVGERRNQAIAAHPADYVAVLDSDDVLTPGSLRVRRDHLDAHPIVALVSGFAELVDANGAPVRVTRHGGAYVGSPPPRRGGEFLRPCHSGNLFRRDWWERVGGYPAGVFPDDEAFHGRLIAAGALFSNLGAVVVRRRIWPGSAWAARSRTKLMALARARGKLRKADARLLRALAVGTGGRDG
jgi:glycosyltransferase involved in cell wall biosynthesis